MQQTIWRCYFNEGGADCPPKPSSERLSAGNHQNFNEGGADCPPKHVKSIIDGGGFNELQ